MIFSILLSASLAFAGGGDHTHNGAGYAEQNFTFAWLTMPQLLETCSKLESSPLVEQMIGAQKNEVDRLHFASAQKNPDLFVGGAGHPWPRMTATAPEVGSQIFVDQDTIYDHDAPFTVTQAAHTLLLTLAQHHKASFPLALSLANRCAPLAEVGFSLSTEEAIGQPQIRARALSLLGQPARLVVSDDETDLDLSDAVSQARLCPVGAQPSRDFQFAIEPAWETLPAWNMSAQSQPLVLRSRLAYLCDGVPFTGELRIAMSFIPWVDGEKIGEDWQLDPRTKLRRDESMKAEINLFQIKGAR